MTSREVASAQEEAGDPALLETIRQRVLSSGPISFADFMQLALYHPDRGYYSRSEDPVGFETGGDYYTAPSRHPAFGTLLGRQVSECLRTIGGRGLQVVEFGPGSGALMVSTLEELRRQGWKIPEEVRPTLVESNPLRAEAQQSKLESAGLARGARWISAREWDTGTDPIRGCVLANEVLDAMPVHRLIFRESCLQELLVGWEAGPIQVLGAPSRPEIIDLALRHCPAPREGQEIEVGLEAVRWVGRLAARLERGVALIVDYGHLAPEIYSRRHHRGTLMAYHRHRATEDYFSRVGRQDLTTHVNFTAVLEAARSAGLEARGPISQGRFLLALGALDLIPGAGNEINLSGYRESRAIQDLFAPGGLGESHQVLVLATPGIDLDLTGLRPIARWTTPIPGIRGTLRDRGGEDVRAGA